MRREPIMHVIVLASALAHVSGLLTPGQVAARQARGRNDVERIHQGSENVSPAPFQPVPVLHGVALIRRGRRSLYSNDLTFLLVANGCALVHEI